MGNEKILQGGFRKPVFPDTLKIKCGSWLACDGAVSGNEALAERPPSQASQLPQILAYICCYAEPGRSLATCLK